MSIIIYGGDKSIVEKQLYCHHDWHGPCIDDRKRYFKCKKCFALDVDCSSYEEYVRNERKDD